MVSRNEGLPARPSGKVDPEATGRGLARVPQPVAQAGPSGDDDGAGSPFGAYAPSANEMHADAERRREASSGVMAIVGGLVFMVGTAAVAMLAALLVGLFLAFRPDRQLAGIDDGLAPIVDTAVAAVGPGRQYGPGPAGPDGPEPDPAATGPQPGTATLIIPPDAMYHSVEVGCPSGFRGRGKFRKGKAKVYNVPSDERCTVTFQGSNYVKWWVSGNMTLVCTQFEPVPKCSER